MINEQLVRQIVQSVLDKLIHNGIVAHRDSRKHGTKPHAIAVKSLVCEQDIISWADNEIKHIPVLSNTLITPLARDRMQQFGMTTRLVSKAKAVNLSRSGTIAIVAPRCYTTFIRRVGESIQGHGFESQEIEARIRSQYDLEILNTRVAQQIVAGDFSGAVIIDELDRRLGSQANRIKGVCAAIGRGSAEHNMIFISQRRYGLAAAAHVIDEWLKARNKDEK
jgi:ribose 5-phosphate isomerase RpiB